MGDSELWQLAVALGIGLLLGIERERHKGRGPGRGAAGVRTFALVSLLGGVSILIGGRPGLVVGAAFVAVAAVVSYVRTARSDDDPGLTTEVALVVAYMLGALATEDAGLAAGIGVAVTILLASRSRLHALVRHTLTEDELHDGLLFAAAALVILPLVPDRDLGPYGAFNPFTIWRLVVIIMAVGAVGHVALRLVGPRFGLPLAGFASGFVSSTLTIVTMGRRAIAEPGLRVAAVAGAVMSSVATIVLTAGLVSAASLSALRELAIPLAFAGLGTIGAGGVAALRSAHSPVPDDVSPGRAFDLRSAVVFALLLSGVILLSAALEDALGSVGVTLAAALAGFADAQAAAASSAALVATGSIPAEDAIVPTIAGLTTNTVTKAVAAAVAGRRRFALGVWPGLVALVAMAWIGVLVAQAA